MRSAIRFFTQYRLLCFFAVSVFLFYSCNQGIAPPDITGSSETSGKTTISGVLRFIGGQAAWPPKDSVLDIRVVAFISYPPTNILGDVIGGKAFYTEKSLAAVADSVAYTIDIPKPPTEFAYIVAAQQYGPDLSKNWRVIGVYTLSGDQTKPSILPVTSGRLHDHIDINVDFAHLPPQPF